MPKTYYDYYCTYCAKKLNNSRVLFDMGRLLTGNGDAKLQLLKFRMTEQDLLALYGEDTQGDTKKKTCTLTFADIIGIIANSSNLNDDRIRALTQQDVEEFLAQGMTAATATTLKTIRKNSAVDDLFAEPEATPEDQSEEKEPEKPYEEPEAISSLLEKDVSLDHEVMARGRLQDDLKILQKVFMANTARQNGSDGRWALTFDLLLNTEEDDRGQKVLTGATAIVNSASVAMLENRVCPNCGHPIFQMAGTAEQRAVVFIGYKASGKTSTLLAMTHYAMNHMQADMGSKIWTGAGVLKDIKEVRLLSPSDRLLRDLRSYQKGIAPEHTDLGSRENAYSATFLIRGQTGEKKVSRILTLTDLPGELCEMGGNLKVNDIYDKFAVATACDTFVTCLDTTAVDLASQGKQNTGYLSGKKEEGEEAFALTPAMVINDTCSWADNFQKMLLLNSSTDRYIPNMLLFTKCRTLEDKVPEDPGPGKEKKKGGVSIQNTYAFRSELNAIKANGKYQVACDRFSDTGRLGSAYHAMLRCSPYGYAAPDPDDIANDPDLLNHLQLPTPRNIDSLVRWLFCLNGCVPIDAYYYPTLDQSRGGLHVDDYFISRPQHREENPIKGSEVYEALARCYLFENPGRYDQEFLRLYDQKWRLIASEFLAHRDGNAE